MKLNKEYCLRKVADENILVRRSGQVDMTSVFSLNESAAWLWNRIGEEEFTEEKLVEWLCAEYDVDVEVAECDVHSLVILWKRYGCCD